MIFINLPVENQATAREFYSALGFTLNPMFSDDNASCFVIEENIFVMLLNHDHFRQFTTKSIIDAKSHVECLNALSRDSRQAVDEIMEKGLASGGTEHRDPQDLGFMYGRAIADPFGHVWEFIWMDPAAAAGGAPDAN